MEFKPMSRLSLRHRRVIAHTNHYGTEPPAQTIPSDRQPLNLLSEPADTLDTDGQETTPIDKADDSPNSNQPEDRTVIEEIPAAQEPAPTSKSGLFDGFSIGLGEPLLVLIVVAPFVLRVWKKRSKRLAKNVTTAGRQMNKL